LIDNHLTPEFRFAKVPRPQPVPKGALDVSLFATRAARV